jgi:hypothetical protein
MSTRQVLVRLASEDGRFFQLAVTVREGADETRHDVTLSRALLARVAPTESADVFVRRCFAFLLEREAKESILPRFDVSVIARYFPEFEKTIAKH